MSDMKKRFKMTAISQKIINNHKKKKEKLKVYKEKRFWN